MIEFLTYFDNTHSSAVTIEMNEKEFSRSKILTTKEIDDLYFTPNLMIAATYSESETVKLIDNKKIMDYNSAENKYYLCSAERIYPISQKYYYITDDLDGLVQYLYQQGYDNALLLKESEVEIPVKYYGELISGNEEQYELSESYITYNAVDSSNKNKLIVVGGYPTIEDAHRRYLEIIDDFPYAFVYKMANINEYKLIIGSCKSTVKAQRILEEARDKDYGNEVHFFV